MVSNDSSDMEFLMNRSRFEYLLDLFKMSKVEVVNMLNKGMKKHLLSVSDLDAYLNQEKKAKLSLLRKVDKIFNKGVTWYVTQREIPRKKSSSIFFRKDSFNTPLNFESKKKIAQYEELKFELETLLKQINLTQERTIEKVNLSSNPKTIAKAFREKIDAIESELIQKKQIAKAHSDREYLQNLIRVFEHLKIFIFEFVDRGRTRGKEINFNGLFMTPYIIVIKRQQKYLRREIFTLIHEFAHFLLDVEEVDENIESNTLGQQTAIEQWCNEFTYYFLIHTFESEFSVLKKASSQNNYYKAEIASLYDKTYLSEFALLTRLKIENKMSAVDYDRIKNEIMEAMRKKEKEDKIKLADEQLLAKEQGKEMFISGPKAIRSKLFDEIVKINYFSGNIKESQLRELLNIKQNKSIEEAIY